MRTASVYRYALCTRPETFYLFLNQMQLYEETETYLKGTGKANLSLRSAGMYGKYSLPLIRDVCRRTLKPKCFRLETFYKASCTM